MRAADVIARRSFEAGIRHAFGIPGGEILTLIDALAAAGIDFVTTRHETAAGLMAEGSAAHTQAPGLLVVTLGPGVSNAVNAVANAYLDRVPMLVVSGAIECGLRANYTHQVLDQAALLRPVCKSSLVAESGAVDATIQHALALAMQHPRGPVHIDLPMDVAVREERLTHVPPETAATPLDEHTLDLASDWLRRAQRPLAIAGLEAVEEVVANELAALLQALEVPLLTTYKAKGVLDEQSPRCIGAIGLSPRADTIAAPLFDAADVVLLVGYDPVEMRARYRQPFATHTRVIELAACERTHGMHSASLTLVGDLTRSLRALRSRIEDRPPAARWRDREPQLAGEALRCAFASKAGFSPETVAETLNRIVPADMRMTVDTGAHRILLSQLFRARAPGQLLQSNGLCTMGYAVPAAIGLALASRRRVVAVTGDGGFDMVAGELATLRDLDLPVTVVVFDDQSLALIDEKQRSAGLERRAVWLGATDHAAVARAFGGHGVCVGNTGALTAALREALESSNGFSVISCRLERGAYRDLL